MVVAADSGLDLAMRLGIEVDLVVGDFDSLSDRTFLDRFDDRVVSFPEGKDETDTEIGIRLARERGASSVTLIGGGGGRLDHLIAIVSLFDRELHPDMWITNNALVLSVETSRTIEGRIGELISFFPVGPVPCRMRSSGLRWQLDGLVWEHGDVGISNVMKEERVKVEMVSGRLIAVRALE
jgi:thiamine pyrophosphokinase